MPLKNFSGSNSNNNNSSNPFGNMSGIGMSQSQSQYDPMDFLIDYNDKYKNSQPILFRDTEVNQVLSTLIGKNKPNALLIGQAGVGKTKVVEDIAQKLANNDTLIPPKLKNKVIYELPISNIVSGSRYVGDLEEKLETIIDFVTDKKNNAILFIDEIHQLVGSNESYNKIAQILKPYMARGEIKLIGATTSQESKSLMDDPAFNRRFSKIIIPELTVDQTLAILENIAPTFIKHFNNKINISTDTLHSVIAYSELYSTNVMHRPDSAITLLDRAMSDLIIHYKQLEKNAQNDPVMLASLQAIQRYNLTDKNVKETALRMILGTSDKATIDFDQLKDSLSKIKGQDNIVDDLVLTLKRNSLNIFPRTKPLSFLFAGTSGVGKTYLSKIIANELYGVKPIMLNMAEYHSSASINRLIGSPKGYVGSNSNSELPFDILETNPYQIILLDEFEKADKSVQRLFMSALDEGEIKTNNNKIIDFSKAIIIATTNAANKQVKKQLGFTKTVESEKDKNNNLAKWFDVELLNRFEKKYNFLPISKDVYKEILISNYEKEVQRITTEFPKIKLPQTLTNDEVNDLTESTYQEMFGARPIEKTVRQFIEDKLI